MDDFTKDAQNFKLVKKTGVNGHIITFCKVFDIVSLLSLKILSKFRLFKVDTRNMTDKKVTICDNDDCKTSTYYVEKALFSVDGAKEWLFSVTFRISTLK